MKDICISLPEQQIERRIMKNNNDRADQDGQDRYRRYCLGRRLRDHLWIPASPVLGDNDGSARRHRDEDVNQKYIQRINHAHRADCRHPGGADHGRIHQAHQNNKSLIHKYRNNDRDNLFVIKRVSREIFI